MATYEHVLVVDDSEIDQLIVKKVLQITNFSKHTIVKNSGQSALEYIAVTPPEELPEIIFLDLNMPVLDGLGFLRIFDSLPDIVQQICKIIVLSSSTSKEDLSKVLESEFVIKVITKPLTIDIIRDFIAGH
ncbi:MAG: response regulator [Verrucomicrobia bacterium]|nr:response regulator [Cytophagales bacterium]